MLTRARLERSGQIGNTESKFRLRQRMVRCGKVGCVSCPHGPYWYAFWTEDGKRRSRYVGRLLDEE